MQPCHIFTFYSSVAPRGGGTLVLAGSHQLLDRLLLALPPGEQPRHSPLIKRFSRSHPWLAELTGADSSQVDRIHRFMETTTDLDGIQARVVEMTGEPGDAILCHPCIFHAVSPNRADMPRFMRVKGLSRHANSTDL